MFKENSYFAKIILNRSFWGPKLLDFSEMIPLKIG